MVFRRLLCVLLALSVSCVLSGCAKPFSTSTVDEIKKQLKNLKAYQCDVKMAVTNNRSTMEYSLKHFYKRPGKYRLEIQAPDELKGQVTIYNGRTAYIYHPGIDQYLMTEDFPDSIEHDAFAGAFAERLDGAGKAQFTRVKGDDKNYLLMEFDIEKGSKYAKREKIWFDIRTAKPWKAEIYDDSGAVRVQLVYDNFSINPVLEDKLFEIAANNGNK